MTFLQPLLLLALPLLSLPIIIHLVYRQRFRTVQWAAMMFLLDARRMARGMARLRFWLIMAMRMLAITALILAAARPLARGAFGLSLGGQADTTIILLDRSPSMQQRGGPAEPTKRDAALDKLAQLLETTGSGSQVVLIESAGSRPRVLDSARQLSDLPDTSPLAATADVPSMLLAALDHLQANRSGRTDIWVCSDLRENDWRPDDGRWSAVRAGFEGLEGVRFFLLSYSEPARDNLSVWVRQARRRPAAAGAELVLDIELHRQATSDEPLAVPLGIVINGARSVLPIEMRGQEHYLQGHTIPLDRESESGWGQIELPNDSNAADNRALFVFADPPVHRTIVVSDERDMAELLRLAAAAPADPHLQYEASILSPQQIDQLDWDATSLILWQAPLPEQAVAGQLEQFAASGRPIVFFPPALADGHRFAEIAWGMWQQAPAEQPLIVSTYRGDSDLLAATNSGMPLPVGQLKVYRYCQTEGSGQVLARLHGGAPLLLRSSSSTAPIYFCSTLPDSTSSSLAKDGVVYYVLIQRALAWGAAQQGAARSVTAGSLSVREGLDDWQVPVGATPPTFSSQRPWSAGVYHQAQQQRWLAINRDRQETMAPVLDDTEMDRLFGGLDYRHVQQQTSSHAALASEIWRAVLILMAAALLIEAWLCLPTQGRVPTSLFSHS